MESEPTLRRVLSFPQLVLYGLGTTIGAGIYALVGELAAVAGTAALASFVLAAVMASFTALSFAELSCRFPRAGGAAVFVAEGFRSTGLSTAVGLLVVAGGLVSAAALINALIDHLIQYLPISKLLGVVLVALLLGAIAAWGIGESVNVAAVITVIEVGGLVLIIWVSRQALAADAQHWSVLGSGFLPSHWGLVFSGALLAFYAFIGFEDMVVVAEEVKGASRTLPLAVLTTLGISTLLYLMVTALALLTFSPQQLGESATPLVDLYRYHTGQSGWIIRAIASLAIVNGALIQIIMAARVLYGLADRGQIPRCLARIHPVTQTPLLTTAIGTLAVAVMAAVGHLGALAQLTSVIMLSVFALANLALWTLKGRSEIPVVAFQVPRWVSAAGFVVSVIFVLRFFMQVIDQVD